MQVRFTIYFIAISLAVGMCFSSGEVMAKPLFNASNEKRSTDISAFNKWTGVLRRHTPDLRKLEKPCASDTSCKKNDWEEALKAIESKGDVDKLKAVNAYVNETKYVQDIVNWGMEDYWATLFEFFTRNGDCEDYAIAKYMSLKKLGFSEDDMRIVILQDHNLGVLHAVLAVYESDGVYILDNQIKTVLKDKRIHHYQPIYSINEHAWWRHLP